MCALCGVLGGTDHWTDSPARPGIFTRSGDALERRRERARRVAIANRVLAHYAMTLTDWQGASFLLTTATGNTALVDNLSHLWSTAEALRGSECDPLDPALLSRLQHADG